MAQHQKFGMKYLHPTMYTQRGLFQQIQQQSTHREELFIEPLRNITSFEGIFLKGNVGHLGLRNYSFEVLVPSLALLST